MFSKGPFFFKSVRFDSLSTRHINCWIAAITKTHRKIYMKKYPVILQQPDGSTINIKYHEPLGVIKLPLNLDELSPEEKALKLLERQPRLIEKKEEDYDFDSSYDESRYLKR